MKRRLLILRHGQAEGFAARDRDRQLTDEGRRNSAQVGRWLAERGWIPDLAMVSSAQRTLQTWAAVATEFTSTGVSETHAELYSAGPDLALESLSGAGPDVETLLYVGHNPTAAYLVQLLDDGSADPGAFAQISRGYPPATVTVLDYDGEWEELAAGTARIVDVYTGGR